MDGNSRQEYFRNYYQQNRRAILDRATEYGKEKRKEEREKRNVKVGFVKRNGVITINFMD